MTQPAMATKPRTINEVYSTSDFQITGITVSKKGRLFLNFPRWSDHYLYAVIEVMPDGSTRPFPDKEWNAWDRKPGTAAEAFVCVQSVVVDRNDSLWILDPAAPLLGPGVAGGAKLVEVNLETNRVVRVIGFPPDVVRPDSYLNDVRFDHKRQLAYITESGAGGIIVVDLVAGTSRRALDGHPSVLAEKDVDIRINGKPVRDSTGKPPMFNSDGIALSADGEYLYYQALTGKTLYRIRTSVLGDAGASPANVERAVERVGETFPVDGLWIDAEDRLYLSGLNQSAILRRLPSGEIETLIADPRIQWPDTFGEGPDGSIYFTTSHIHETPAYNDGKPALTSPYAVFKFLP